VDGATGLSALTGTRRTVHGGRTPTPATAEDRVPRFGQGVLARRGVAIVRLGPRRAAAVLFGRGVGAGAHRSPCCECLERAGRAVALDDRGTRGEARVHSQPLAWSLTSARPTTPQTASGPRGRQEHSERLIRSRQPARGPGPRILALCAWTRWREASIRSGFLGCTSGSARRCTILGTAGCRRRAAAA
jgi:hypothetical protein